MHWAPALIPVLGFSLFACLRRKKLSDFFYHPATPGNLAVFRIIIFTALFFEGLLHAHLSWYTRLPEELQIGPDWYLFLSLPQELSGVFFVLFLLSALMAASGILNNISAIICVVLSFYVLGYPHSFDTPNHLCNHDHHLIWFAAVIAVSRSYDVLTLNRLFKGRSPVPSSSPAYGFPLRTLWVLMGLIYFFPGYWKLFRTGSGWFLPDNLKCLIYERWHELGAFTPLLRIDHYPLLFKAGAVWVVFFELSFIFLILSRRWRRAAIIQGLLFHTLTFLTLKISFWSLVICYSAFIHWTSLAKKLHVPAAQPHPLQSKQIPGPSLRLKGVAFLLIVSVLIHGAFYIDSWPFAVYPSFSRGYDCTITTVDVRAYSKSGQELPVRDNEPRRYFTPPRWKRLLQHLFHLTGEERRRFARSLAKVLIPGSTLLQKAERFEFHKTLRDISPEGGILKTEKIMDVSL